ncbi:Hypothetical protein SMAX5B_021636 [Scophthalmus maximus]|uniref:Uncharacterized protein n=1 Tax=Scophthalmus maximus TaxID=52904 RepID=A0A2U9B0W3_SCOMX|nr:Hypothetical protein SMAX5B_021636 [Scophthalmus maximus]
MHPGLAATHAVLWRVKDGPPTPGSKPPPPRAFAFTTTQPRSNGSDSEVQFFWDHFASHLQ